MPIAVSPQCFIDYKYSFLEALQSISDFFTFSPRVFSLSLHLLTMEDKRGSKRSRFSTSGSSSSSSDASTPPPSPFKSLLPPVSPQDMSLHMPPSPMHEHGGLSEGIQMVDLSSRE
jgi:hypothetical protein